MEGLIAWIEGRGRLGGSRTVNRREKQLAVKQDMKSTVHGRSWNKCEL